jgi:hypothetical protein
VAILAALSASAGGGRFVPDKPVIVIGSQASQFVINNYDASLIYNLSVTAGTATRSGNTITLSSGDAICTVSCYSQKGITASTGTYERKSYTYSCRPVSQTCCDSCCGWVGSCSCGPAPCGPGGSPNGQCGCGGGVPCMYGTVPQYVCNSCNCHDCSYTVCDVLIDQTGNGYTNRGTEWYKVG